MFASRSDHIRFQQHSFEEDFIISQSLEHSLVDSFGDLLADFNGMVSIGEDFGFDDGDESIGLADGSVSGEAPSVFLDGLLAGAAVGVDLQGGSPFGESASHGVVFFASFVEGVEAGGPGLTVGSREDLEALVHFDTGDDVEFF